jgi:hypothetical protein
LEPIEARQREAVGEQILAAEPLGQLRSLRLVVGDAVGARRPEVVLAQHVLADEDGAEEAKEAVEDVVKMASRLRSSSPGSPARPRAAALWMRS